MTTSDKISIAALCCSVALPVASHFYLSEQIKAFDDKQLVYSQNSQTTVEKLGPDCADVDDFTTGTIPETPKKGAKQATEKSKSDSGGSSGGCRMDSKASDLVVTLGSVGKLPVSHLSISVSTRGTLPPDRFVSITSTPPISIKTNRLTNGLDLIFGENFALSPGTDPISVDIKVTTFEHGVPITEKFDFVGAVVYSDGKSNPGLAERKREQEVPEVPGGN